MDALGTLGHDSNSTSSLSAASDGSINVLSRSSGWLSAAGGFEACISTVRTSQVPAWPESNTVHIMHSTIRHISATSQSTHPAQPPIASNCLHAARMKADP
jgi:hypothetical protein